MSTKRLPTPATLCEIVLRISRKATFLTRQHTSQTNMAPKNNKGKAKEPEKAGVAKVKGG